MKMNFCRFSVLLMYLMVIGLPIVCILIGNFPSDVFIICWYSFWCVQAIATMTLTMNKRKRNISEKAIEKISEYINEENANKIIEKFVGIKPTVRR